MANTPSSTAGPRALVFDQRRNALVLTTANVSLGQLADALRQHDGLDILPTGAWLLKHNLIIPSGTSLTIQGSEIRQVLLKSDADGFVWLKALGGNLTIQDVCISSWDAQAGAVDTNYDDGRAFILARDGATMRIHRSSISYLGYQENESYGLAWRLPQTHGELTDSTLSYNFYGMYTYEVSDMLIRGNEVHHNIRYGIDPHTRSNRLRIEGNSAHHNGKQGIILAEACEDGIIRNNVTYANGIHGIVVYQQSNRAVVEGNHSYDNANQGININDSDDAIVRNNYVHGNRLDGIGIGQHAAGTTVVGNTVEANVRDGITIYSDASGTAVDGNTVRDNGRYGIYAKSSGNQVHDNRVTNNGKQDILQ